MGHSDRRGTMVTSSCLALPWVRIAIERPRLAHGPGRARYPMRLIGLGWNGGLGTRTADRTTTFANIHCAEHWPCDAAFGSSSTSSSTGSDLTIVTRGILPPSLRTREYDIASFRVSEDVRLY